MKEETNAMRHLLGKKSLPTLLAAVAVIGLYPGARSDAGPHVRVFDGLGTRTVLGVPGYHDILSWSWGETNDASEGDGGGIFNDVVLVLPTSNASIRLLDHLCSEASIEAVTITTVIAEPPRGAGDTKSHHIVLHDVYISSYQTGGSAGAGDVVPTDQVSLNFSTMESIYEEIGADGSVRVRVERECANPGRSSQ
jgi:type VI protein secretion system component Hcp